jgi:hypothetical protein
MANKWIKFLQNYTKKQKQKNPKYTYMKAMKDPNAKRMYKKYGGNHENGDEDEPAKNEKEDEPAKNEKEDEIINSDSDDEMTNVPSNFSSGRDRFLEKYKGGQKKSEKKTRKRRKNKSCKSCKSVSFF